MLLELSSIVLLFRFPLSCFPSFSSSIPDSFFFPPSVKNLCSSKFFYPQRAVSFHSFPADLASPASQTPLDPGPMTRRKADILMDKIQLLLFLPACPHQLTDRYSAAWMNSLLCNMWVGRKCNCCSCRNEEKNLSKKCISLL